MKEIKSFVYLDTSKMYSISSQIFEGLTEYILKEDKSYNSITEEQKGPIRSGKILGDIISKTQSKQEKIFLHDYSYTLFEEKLFSLEKVLNIDCSNITTDISKIESYNFIKVRGKLIFKDIKVLSEILNNYNKLAESLTYLTNFGQINELKNGVAENSQNKRNKSKNNNPTNFKITPSFLKQLTIDSGLYQDEMFLNHLVSIFNFGYNDLFEILIPFDNDYLFSAILDRANIIENENTLIKKYSRKTEKDFVLFGIITQAEKVPTIDSSEINFENKELKIGIQTLVDRFANIEDTFVGRLQNEYIIDPIAVYREL